MSHATSPFTRMSHATFPLPACHTPPSLYPHTVHPCPCPCPCMYTHTRTRTYYASALRRSVVPQSQRIAPLGHTPKPAHYVARPHTKASALRRLATHQSQRIASLGHTPKPAHYIARPHTKASALRRSATHQSQRITLLGHTLKPAHCVAWPFTKAIRASRVRRGSTTSLSPPIQTKQATESHVTTLHALS